MIRDPYVQLIQCKQLADQRLYGVVGQSLDKLTNNDAATVIGILDHIHVVDRLFQCNLQQVPHGFSAPRSSVLPVFNVLRHEALELDDWYASYAAGLSDDAFDQSIDFTFTNKKPGKLSRGEIILHVCLHGTYHRGNVGIVLKRNGVELSDVRMTDYIDLTRPVPVVAE